MTDKEKKLFKQALNLITELDKEGLVLEMGLILEMREALAQTEPVALKMVYGEVCCQSKHDDQSFGMWCPITEKEFPNGTPFYTEPSRKEWVGLTDDEINKIANSPQPIDETSNGYVLPFAHAIEAHLKELNT
jgi:hypothetical protein